MNEKCERSRCFLSYIDEFVFKGRVPCYYFVITLLITCITLPYLLSSLMWLREICTRFVKTMVTREENNNQKVSSILLMAFPWF